MNLRATTKRRACGQPCGRCSNSAISHLRLTGSYEMPGSSRLKAVVKRATTAYCADRASRATNTGLKPKPASARTRNSRMSGGTLAKLVSSTSMLPGQVDESLQQSVVDAVHLLPEGIRVRGVRIDARSEDR